MSAHNGVLAAFLLDFRTGGYPPFSAGMIPLLPRRRSQWVGRRQQVPEHRAARDYAGHAAEIISIAVIRAKRAVGFGGQAMKTYARTFIGTLLAANIRCPAHSRARAL